MSLDDNLVFFAGAPKGDQPAALWDSSGDIVRSIAWERNMLRSVLQGPESYRGHHAYAKRSYCATLRHLRCALRLRPTVEIPAWVIQLAEYDGNQGDLYSRTDAELVSRLNWIEEVGKGVGCIHLKPLSIARDQIQIQMGRRWLKAREDRGHRLAAANRKRAQRNRWAA
jgi:hypothetical protein